MLTIASHVSNELGECPLWCERTRRLYWTDIEGRELLAMQEDSEEISRWSLPERLGSFALTDEENVLLMGFESRLGYYDLQNGIFTLVAASPGAQGTRINDGRCDRAGNFVFSSMHDGNSLQAIGKFHRLNAATLETETLSLPAVAIPNQASRQTPQRLRMNGHKRGEQSPTQQCVNAKAECAGRKRK